MNRSRNVPPPDSPPRQKTVIFPSTDCHRSPLGDSRGRNFQFGGHEHPMATLMPGSAIRLSRALPAWLRPRSQSARDLTPRLILGLIGALLIWQCVRLLWALLVPLSPLGAWQPATALIAPPAERRALFTAFDPFFRSA